MAEAPRYQELKDERANVDMQRQQKMQQSQVSQEAVPRENPILQQYMQKGLNAQPQDQQGLDAGDYGRVAAQVANSVGSQEEYADRMFEGVTKGALDPRGFLSDPNVPDMSKRVLMSLMSGGPQDEIAPEGLNPR